MSTTVHPHQLPEVQLFTPDPHHLPGYCGWFPEKLTNSFGKTFAHVTHDNLTAHRENNPQCASILPPGKYRHHGATRPYYRTVTDRAQLRENNDEQSQIEDNLLIQQHLTKSGGHPKWKGFVAPHYTGAMPQERNIIGSTYEKGVRTVLAQHEQQCSEQEQLEQMLLAKLEPPLELRESMDLPFKFHSKHVWLKTAENPYFMPPGHPLKYFIPGTGYVVPLWQNRFGHTFSEATRECLTEFTLRHAAYQSAKENPFQMRGKAGQAPQASLLNGGSTVGRASKNNTMGVSSGDNALTLTPSHPGVIPGYTGHIPASKFRFGMPYSKCAKVFRYGLVWPPYDDKVGMQMSLEEQVLEARKAEFEHAAKQATLKRALEDIRANEF